MHMSKVSLKCNSFCCCCQARQELEKIRRRLEAELADLREQLNEKSSQLEELQAQMNKREEELQRALNRSVKSTYTCTQHKLTSVCFPLTAEFCLTLGIFCQYTNFSLIVLCCHSDT